MWPVMEMAPTFNQLNLVNTADSTTANVNPGTSTNQAINRAFRSALYYCPTRGFRQGQHGTAQAVDYIPITITYFPSGYYVTGWSHVTSWVAADLNPNGANDHMQGPFQYHSGSVATPTAPGGVVVRSRVTFGGITDGMSYTAFFGEKHVTPANLGTANFDYPRMVGYAGSTWETGKIPGLGLAPRADWPQPTAMSNTDQESYRMGSWHPGTAQFAFGDTRVQAVKTYAQGTALQAMGGRGDSTPYDLP